MKKYELRHSKSKSSKFSRLFKIIKKTFINTSNIFITTSTISKICYKFVKYQQIIFRFKFEYLNLNDFENSKNSKNSRFELEAQS